MQPFANPESIQFADPQWLWLLLVSAVLLVVWVRQLGQRRRDARRLAETRRVPVKERLPFFGDTIFSL